MNELFHSEIENALRVLREGGVILYPTDTIWGLGCDATRADTVRKIYEIKNRDDRKSMIILLPDERSVLQYVAAPDPLAFDFLAGQSRPTTMIFDHALGLPDNLVAEDGSIGIRIVKDEFCRHLLLRLKKPIVSTSANISGQPSPANFAGVDEKVVSAVDYIVKWRQDEVGAGAPSQVVKWKDGQVEFLRK